MSGTRAISTTLRQVSLFLQGKAPKEIYAILTETLVSFFPGRAMDLSAPLWNTVLPTISRRELLPGIFPARQGAEGNSRHSDRKISLFTSWSD